MLFPSINQLLGTHLLPWKNWESIASSSCLLRSLKSGLLQGRFHHLLSPDASRQLLAISVNNVQGTFFPEEKRDLYWWLYRYDSIHQVGYSIYPYDITGYAEAFVNLGVVYSRYHPGSGEARTCLNQLPASK